MFTGLAQIARDLLQCLITKVQFHINPLAVPVSNKYDYAICKNRVLVMRQSDSSFFTPEKHFVYAMAASVLALSACFVLSLSFPVICAGPL